jgi:hypothetical protein
MKMLMVAGRSIVAAGVFAAMLLLSAGANAQRTVKTSAYPGDLGAQINAADAALGVSIGTIVVDQPASAKTLVTLGHGHALQLNAPTHWETNVTLLGNNTITCGGEKAQVELALPGRWYLFHGKGVDNIRVENCWARAINPGGNSYYFVAAASAKHVVVTHCHAVDIPLLVTGGGAPTTAGTTDANATHDVEFSYNSVELPSPAWKHQQATGVVLASTIGAKVMHNEFHHLVHGLQYWGGDNGSEWKSPATPHWARDIVISDNNCSDVGGSCYWGGMGQNIQYLRNRAERCGDACLDVEGDNNDLIDGNTVIDGNLGILWRNNHLEYRNNRVITTHGNEPLVHVSNNSGKASLNTDIRIHDNVFECQDPVAVCNIEYQDVQGFAFDHNQVTNGVFHPYDRGQVGTSVTNNTFTFTHPVPPQIGGSGMASAAVEAGWQVKGGMAKVMNNTILSNAPQPKGSRCILLQWGDTEASAEYWVQGNTCGGKYPFDIDLEMVAQGRNPGVGVTFHVTGNNFARNHIVQTNPMGNARFDIRGNGR